MGIWLVLSVVSLLVMLSIIINSVIVMPVLIAKLVHGDSTPNKGVTNLPTNIPVTAAKAILIILK